MAYSPPCVDPRCFNNAFYGSPAAKISGNDEILYQPKARRRSMTSGTKFMHHIEKYVPLYSHTRRDTLHCVAFRSDKSPVSNLPYNSIPGARSAEKPVFSGCSRIWNFYVPWRFLSRSSAPPDLSYKRGNWGIIQYTSTRDTSSLFAF